MMKPTVRSMPMAASGEIALEKPWLFWFNTALTVALIICLLMALMPLPILFIVAFAIALVANYPQLGGPAEASGLPRRQRRHGLDHDLCRRHLHGCAHRNEDDRGHGIRRRVGHS